jgi:hypothetical protein
MMVCGLRLERAKENQGVLLRANPPKGGDAELRGYSESARHACRAASESNSFELLAAFVCGRREPV